MLDVGGFSLASMADQARENGDEQAANRARATGYLLIAIMIVTLLLVSVGLLWPHLRDVTGGDEKGLILLRVVMTVVYGHVLHSLRARAGGALSPIQVVSLEQRMQEQVAQMSEALDARSSQLVANVQTSVSSLVAHEVAKIAAILSDQVAQNLATLHDSLACEVTHEVAKISIAPTAPDSELSEQIAALVTLVHDQAHTVQHLTNELANMRREVRTTATEIRSFAHDVPVLPPLASAIVDASSEPGEKIRAFLASWSSPKKPTLQQIMDSCQVAKKTATRYRNEFYGLATTGRNEEDE